MTKQPPRPFVGQAIKINDDAPLFAGHKAVVAYVGDDGISVYLADSEIDECIPLKNGEWS